MTATWSSLHVPRNILGRAERAGPFTRCVIHPASQLAACLSTNHTAAAAAAAHHRRGARRDCAGRACCSSFTALRMGPLREPRCRRAMLLLTIPPSFGSARLVVPLARATRDTCYRGIADYGTPVASLEVALPAVRRCPASSTSQSGESRPGTSRSSFIPSSRRLVSFMTVGGAAVACCAATEVAPVRGCDSKPFRSSAVGTLLAQRVSSRHSSTCARACACEALCQRRAIKASSPRAMGVSSGCLSSTWRECSVMKRSRHHPSVRAKAASLLGRPAAQRAAADQDAASSSRRLRSERASPRGTSSSRGGDPCGPGFACPPAMFEAQGESEQGYVNAPRGPAPRRR